MSNIVENIWDLLNENDDSCTTNIWNLKQVFEAENVKSNLKITAIKEN